MLSRLTFSLAAYHQQNIPLGPHGTPSKELIELNCINMTHCMSFQLGRNIALSLMPSCLWLYGILIPALKRDTCFIISSKQLSHGCLFTAKPDRIVNTDSKHMHAKFPQQFEYRSWANTLFLRRLRRSNLTSLLLAAGSAASRNMGGLRSHGELSVSSIKRR